MRESDRGTETETDGDRDEDREIDDPLPTTDAAGPFELSLYNFKYSNVSLSKITNNL